MNDEQHYQQIVAQFLEYVNTELYRVVRKNPGLLSSTITSLIFKVQRK